MGIANFHKSFKFCTRQGSVQEFAGQTLTVDASSWLHKSVYSIAEHYVEAYERGRIDARCVNTSANYILKRCNELFKFAGIARIVLVMDGKRCPLKAATNNDREERRTANLKVARECKRKGQKSDSEEKYRSCIKIGSDLTDKVMARVKLLSNKQHLPLTFVWAPYEADAQMVKVCMEGGANAIVTEDSDVLVYLAACHASFPVLFKLDRASGRCDILSMDWLLTGSFPPTMQQHGKKGKKKSSDTGLESVLKSLMFRQSKNRGQGVRLFVQACCLSGCDYVDSLNGVGLITAFKMVRENAITEDVFKGVLNTLPSKSKKDVDLVQYKENLSKSEAVFFYHPVKTPDGTVTTLLDPCETDANKFLPALDQFKGDLSFLGTEPFLNDLATHMDPTLVQNPQLQLQQQQQQQDPNAQGGTDTSSVDSNSENKPPIAEIIIPAMPSKHSSKRAPLSQLDDNHNVAGRESKCTGDELCDDLVQQFGVKNNETNKDNGKETTEPRKTLFAVFAFKSKADQDPRFVKRQFKRPNGKNPPRASTVFGIAKFAAVVQNAPKGNQNRKKAAPTGTPAVPLKFGAATATSRGRVSSGALNKAAVEKGCPKQKEPVTLPVVKSRPKSSGSDPLDDDLHESFPNEQAIFDVYSKTVCSELDSNSVCEVSSVKHDEREQLVSARTHGRHKSAGRACHRYAADSEDDHISEESAGFPNSRECMDEDPNVISAPKQNPHRQHQKRPSHFGHSNDSHNLRDAAGYGLEELSESSLRFYNETSLPQHSFGGQQSNKAGAFDPRFDQQSEASSVVSWSSQNHAPQRRSVSAPAERPGRCSNEGNHSRGILNPALDPRSDEMSEGSFVSELSPRRTVNEKPSRRGNELKPSRGILKPAQTPQSDGISVAPSASCPQNSPPHRHAFRRPGNSRDQRKTARRTSDTRLQGQATEFGEFEGETTSKFFRKQEKQPPRRVTLETRNDSRRSAGGNGHYTIDLSDSFDDIVSNPSPQIESPAMFDYGDSVNSRKKVDSAIELDNWDADESACQNVDVAKELDDWDAEESAGPPRRQQHAASSSNRKRSSTTAFKSKPYRNPKKQSALARGFQRQRDICSQGSSQEFIGGVPGPNATTKRLPHTNILKRGLLAVERAVGVPLQQRKKTKIKDYFNHLTILVDENNDRDDGFQV